MADNTTLDAGTGGDTLRTEDRTTFKVPVSLIDVGGTSAEAILGDASVVWPAYNTVKDGSGTFYCPLVDSDGHLQVDILSTVSTAVTNAGTFAVQEDGAALTALQVIDNVVHVDDAAFTLGTSSGVMMMGFAGTQSVNANDAGAIAMETDGSIHIHDGGNTITVDGTVTANPASGTIDTVTTVSTVTNVSQLGGASVPIGAGLETTAIRVTLPTDGTGIVGLAAGTNAIGKLSANSGVDIGDVDVLSVIPGTGATNLGKAIDTAVGATDTGVGLLAHHKEDLVHLTSADGDWDTLTLDSLGQLHVNAEGHHVFDNLDATTGWTALGNDTLNLATTTNHVQGTNALTFDKVDGAANTVFAGIQKTLSSTDLGDVSLHDILQGAFYIPSLADVNYLFLRLGTDSSNYNEWRLDADLLTAGVWETGSVNLGDADHTGNTGTGLNSSAITYIAVGVAFNAETDTLAGMMFDQLSYHTNQHTSSSINSEVTSSISSANVNIQKIGNKVVQTQAGNVSTGTQRITIATDDANLAAINGTLLGGLTTPVIDSYQSAAINVGAGATDSVLVAAPGASKQIWVYALVATADVAGSFSFQDEDDTAITGVMPVGATGGFVLNSSGNMAMPAWKLATNKALEMDTVTCSADGSLAYAVVSV